MHADGDWLAVEGALSKDMATLGEYLQTWKLKLSTTKTVSAVFYLNNKEAKRELKVNFNNKTLPFCSEPKYLGVTMNRLLTYRWHFESHRKKLTSHVALLRWLADYGWGAGATILWTATIALVCSTAEYCAPVWCRSAHTRLTDPQSTMPASYTSGQPFNPRRHLTCWASSPRSHTISRTPCHRAWTPAPLSAHLSIGCSCMAPQIETPICTCRATTHQFFWQQQHTYGAEGGSSMECGVGGQPHKTLHFKSWHWCTPPWNDPPKKNQGPAQLPLHQCWTFPLLLVQMGYGLLCGLWVWRRTDCRPCCPPLSNPLTLPWTTWPDGSGRWDNEWLLNTCPDI